MNATPVLNVVSYFLKRFLNAWERNETIGDINQLVGTKNFLDVQARDS